MSSAAFAAGARASFGLFLLLLGGLLVASGSLQLYAIMGAYRQRDLLLTETPDTFQVWLAALAIHKRGEDARLRLPERVADRLAIMSLPARRSLVVMMSRATFWEELQSSGTTARDVKALALQGVYRELAREPAAGDLYFAAAWLETFLNGFGLQSRGLLVASRQFAPRELDLAVARLRLVALVWNLMSDDERVRATQDFDFIRDTQPEKAKLMAGELASMGVVFD